MLRQFLFHHLPPVILPVVTVWFLASRRSQFWLFWFGVIWVIPIALTSVWYEYEPSSVPQFPPHAASFRTFLPAPGEAGREEIYRQLRMEQRNNDTLILESDDRDGYVLITGASRGIGRAMVIELARRYGSGMKFLLVGRSQADLEGVAQDVRECYGTTTHVHILLADLAKNDPDTAYQLYSKIRNTHGIRVRVAIFNAGTMGRVQNHYDLSNENHNQQLLPMMALNIQSTTLLSSLVASDMMDHEENDDAGRRGRIMFVASIVGTAPGLPGSAVYGATKAYIRSLSHGLRDELRLSDKKNSISVSCLLPGATTGTDFAARGQLESAAVWNYPFSVSTAETVARHAIDGMMRGDAEIFPGTPLNTIMAKVAIPLLPPSLSTWFMGFSWRPWPFSFPPKWRPSHLVSAKQYEERSTDGTKSETNANAKTCTKEYEEIPFVVHID